MASCVALLDVLLRDTFLVEARGAPSWAPDRADAGEDFPKKRWVRTKIDKRLLRAARLHAAVRREEWDGPGGQGNPPIITIQAKRGML